MARRGKRVRLRRDDARDAAVRPRVLEVRPDVEDAEGAHIAKVYYTGPMTGGTNRRPWLPYALAAVAAAMAALVYLNALDNPFVYDDHRVVLENYSIRDLSNVRALFLNDVFRPVVNISYALDYARAGLAPSGYHLTSLLLHMANVVLLFVLVRVLAGDARAMRNAPAAVPAAAAPSRVGKEQRPVPASANAEPNPEVADTANTAAFAAAAIWAVHPLMTQAVGYVSGRSELLCALFMLTSFLCLHAWLFRRGGAWLVAGIASWMLALASKEVAVMLPVVLLVHSRLLLPRADGDIRQRLARVCVPMLAFVAVAGAARLFVFAGVENVSRASYSWSNILVGIDVVRRYTALVFMTAPQSIFHSALQPPSIFGPKVILDALWMIALAVLAWRVYLRAPLVSFGALWFVLMLLPSVSMLILDVGEPMAEQRAYVAGGGFAMATGAAFARLRTWPASHRVSARAVVTVIFGLLLVMMALRTIARNEIWSDPVRLWSEAAANAPGIWLPHRGLGDALRDKGDYAGAADAYREAARLRPEEPNTHLALGVSLLVAGRLDESDAALAEAARLSPGMAQAETARGMIARMTGRRDEARDRFLAVARAHPERRTRAPAPRRDVRAGVCRPGIGTPDVPRGPGPGAAGRGRGGVHPAQRAAAGRSRQGAGGTLMARPRIVAIVSAFNEDDIIGPALAHLVAQGASVYLLDDGSTDRTVANATEAAGSALIGVETLPPVAREDGTGAYSWSRILDRKAQLAHTLDGDWFIHQDADEFRESPWPHLSLADAVGLVDRLGWNAIDFEVFDFVPAGEDYRPGQDPVGTFRRYHPAAEYDRLQIRCWKKTAAPVDLTTTGGHEARFPRRRVFPVRFPMRHYPIRSAEQGERKVFRDRKPRFDPEERARGWHVQYRPLRRGPAGRLPTPLPRCSSTPTPRGPAFKSGTGWWRLPARRSPPATRPTSPRPCGRSRTTSSARLDTSGCSS